MVFGGWEKEENLFRAWEREKKRFYKINLSEKKSLECVSGWRLAYPELANQSKYIEKYQAVFGTDNVLVVDITELKNSAKTVYNKAINFLELETDNRSDFKIINANKSHKYTFVKNSLHFVARQRALLSVLRFIKSNLGISTFGIFEYVKNKNTKQLKRESVPPILSKDIIDFVSNIK